MRATIARSGNHPRYAKCVELSRRIRWDIERDVIRGRRFDREHAERVGDTLLRACRWQYILSGVEEERFANIIGNLVSEAQGQRIGEALLPLTA